MGKKSSRKSARRGGIGDRLQLARNACGFSAAQAARRLGVKSETLRKWEAGDSEPRANRLVSMAGVLNVSLGWLLTGDGQGPDSAALTGDLKSVIDSLSELRHAHALMAENLDRLEAQIRDMGADV